MDIYASCSHGRWRHGPFLISGHQGLGDPRLRGQADCQIPHPLGLQQYPLGNCQKTQQQQQQKRNAFQYNF